MSAFFPVEGAAHLISFLSGTVLAGYLPASLAFFLAGSGLLGWIWKTASPAAEIFGFAPAIFPLLLILAAYLTGNALPWRRLEPVRGRLYKLFFSVCAVYLFLLGGALLAAWRLNYLEACLPWALCFTAAFFLPVYQQSFRRMLSLPARGPLTAILPPLMALSVFVALAAADIIRSEIWDVAQSLVWTAVFFLLWFLFVRLAKMPPGSLLARALQLGFIWLVYLAGRPAVTCALALGAANALSGLKVLDTKCKLELEWLLGALVFWPIIYYIRLDWPVWGAAALLWAGRFLVFHLYNLLAGLCLFGADFTRRINRGLQVSGGTLILLLWLWRVDTLVLSAAVLVALAEQLIYPFALKRALAQSGELQI
ncbi:MAG: hypothetical protein LBD99_02290 [Candidatus Margulisbacteria bacterium]|nr:hypothetical protein [Candidatus Margulisiibacteriota bacterium]